MQLCQASDGTGKITIIWFNQPFLVKMLIGKKNVKFSGKVNFFGQKLAIISPDYEIGEKSIHTARLVLFTLKRQVYHQSGYDQEYFLF